MHQECLMGIGDVSQCEFFKYKDNYVCQDTTEDLIVVTNSRIYHVLETEKLIQIKAHP